MAMHAVYNFWKGGELQGQVLLHVDDLLYGETDLFHRKVIASFMRTFTVGSKEEQSQFRKLVGSIN